MSLNCDDMTNTRATRKLAQGFAKLRRGLQLVPVLAICTTITLAQSPSVSPPIVLNADAPTRNVYCLPDGTLQLLYPVDGKEVVSISSTDSGNTWSEPKFEFPFPDAPGGIPVTLVDRDGELHAFIMLRRGQGRPSVTLFYDIWHCRTADDRTRWTAPKRIFEGYVGSINGVTQLESGRIVLPHQVWVPGARSAPPTGSHFVTTTYSDDGGDTWHLSPAQLTAPCYPNYIGNNYGACEPSIVAMSDGRTRMYMRSQTGYLYESLSTDGAEWSEAQPSPFHSSSSPPSLLRLRDGRIVVVWNNCEDPSRVDGGAIYTNRDALHAAISEDDGKTWLGFREVRRDPFRNESPPKSGDRGTAYPFTTQAANGNIILVSGQGHGRTAMLSIDPRWLTATAHEDDFSGGLDGWSTFKPFGPVVRERVWRDRTEGPLLVPHPRDPSAKVLHVRRPDDKPGDDAVWNFPAGVRGSVSVRLLLRRGFHGAEISLTDRFIQPGDPKARELSPFSLAIDSAGIVTGGQALELERWHTIELAWDLDRAECNVKVNGAPSTTLAIDFSESGRNPDAENLSYLRLRAPAEQPDVHGFLVEHVRARIDR